MKRKERPATQTSARFVQHTHRAIALLIKNEAKLENEKVMNLFAKNGIPYNDAIEIFLFLPIAFVRSWFPQIKWQDTYTEVYDTGIMVKKRFSETDSFLSIMTVAEAYFMANPQKDLVLKIAGRSAEFQAMNRLLLDDPQAKLEEVTFSETIIRR